MGDEEVKVCAQCHGCKFTWDDMPDADICLKYPDGKPNRIVCVAMTSAEAGPKARV